MLRVRFTVEVLRRHRLHRLARGLQRESGSGSLLPGALPELWAELHQYVLEPGEYTLNLRSGSTRGFPSHVVSLYVKQA